MAGLAGGGGRLGHEARASGRALPPQIDRFIPVTKLKYYFAVDTLYVGKKLGLLFFPYLHQVSAPPTEVKDSLWVGGSGWELSQSLGPA